MKKSFFISLIIFAVLSLSNILTMSGAGKKGTSAPLSPSDIEISKDNKMLYVAERTGKRIDIVNIRSKKIVHSIMIPGRPTGLVLAGNKLYVTSSSPAGKLHIIDIKKLKIISSIKAGMGACSPVLSPDNKKIYLCNKFNNDISIIDLKKKKEISRIQVSREPVSAVLAMDGKYLYIANLLPAGRADADYVSANVDVIDTGKKKKIKSIQMPNGSVMIRGICISPDHKYIYAVHNVARYHVPTTQLERGWMNTSALTVIDAENMKIINTVLLDDVDHGAANPWGVASTSDNKYICVTHSGTHELSLIDREALLEKLSNAEDKENIVNLLSFVYDIRKRIKLKGNGPRALIAAGKKVFITEYFSDTINIVDLSEKEDKPDQIFLNPDLKMTKARKGEICFSDATKCFQNWQSCTSCHPDTRSDALNWDLLNDGLGNPKNSKSLLLTFQTPPVMITGIRPDAKTCVRSGFKFIQFAVVSDERLEAVDEFLKSLKPMPSPYLVNGELSKSAVRGKAVFKKAGCISCHSGELGTDLKQYDMKEGTGLDKGREFDTPALVEVWRTGPYLYDGRAAFMKEVFSKYKHGIKIKLNKKEIDDLTEYVNSFGPLK